MKCKVCGKKLNPVYRKYCNDGVCVKKRKSMAALKSYYKNKINKKIDELKE